MNPVSKNNTAIGIIAALVACLACMSSPVSAGVSYAFEDKIDNWGPSGLLDATLVIQNLPLSYTHDLNQEVDFAAGHQVTEAYLELDFTNDAAEGDSYKLAGIIKWDFREYASVAFDGGAWIPVASGAEIDDDAYPVVLDIEWLNDDGFLDVKIAISNPLGTGRAWLDHSRVYGTAQVPDIPDVPTVPAPGAALLGMLGLAAARKLRRLL
jgi:hypothetical protein